MVFLIKVLPGFFPEPAENVVKFHQLTNTWYLMNRQKHVKNLAENAIRFLT